MPESLFERMSALARKSGDFKQPDDSLYAIRSKIEPPADAEATYRGWVIWHDWGDFEHGICYRETKWRAQSPKGVQIARGCGYVGTLAWIKAEIDRRENA